MGPLLMPNLSGGADPQANSVSHSGVAPSAWFVITARTRWIAGAPVEVARVGMQGGDVEVGLDPADRVKA